MTQTELKTRIKQLTEDGTSLADVAKALNKEGRTTKHGKPFTAQTVHYWSNPYKKRVKMRERSRMARGAPKNQPELAVYDRFAVMKAVHHCGDFSKATRTALIDLILKA